MAERISSGDGPMAAPIVNVDQAENWDGAEGAHWAAHQAHFDAAIGPQHRGLMAAAAVSPGERVLDIGCGCGQTSRDAARAAGPGGSVLGADLSGPMLARARQLAGEEDVANVRFEQADAQVHPFPAAAFDLVISRLGVMFFADPVAAFANLAAALRPGGRLAVLVWQAIDVNPWVLAFRNALSAGRDLPVPPPGAPSPFGLADQTTTTGILAAAGFSDVTFRSVEETFTLGTDAGDAYRFAAGLTLVESLLADLDDDTRAAALEKLKAAFVAHETPEGVVFAAASWIVTAEL